MAIPREIKSAQQRSPSTTITIAAALGGSSEAATRIYRHQRDSAAVGGLLR